MQALKRSRPWDFCLISAGLAPRGAAALINYHYGDERFLDGAGAYFAFDICQDVLIRRRLVKFPRHASAARRWGP